MLGSRRIDAFATDSLVLIAIFFLQWMHRPTSIDNICAYYERSVLETDAAKAGLKRLKKGGVISKLKGGRGITAEYQIHISEVNRYFENTIPSESTRYRSFGKLVEQHLLRYDNTSGNYVFDARGFLKTLQREGADIRHMLKSLTRTVAAYLKHSIPTITVKRFITILDGQAFTFNRPLLSLSDDVLNLCQKALYPLEQ